MAELRREAVEARAANREERAAERAAAERARPRPRLSDERPRHPPLIGFVVRVLIIAAIGMLFFAAWHARGAIVLAFAATLVALLIDALSWPFRVWLRFPRLLATSTTIILVIVILAGLFYLVGHQVQNQATELINQITSALNSLQKGSGVPLFGSASDMLTSGNIQKIIGYVANYGLGIFGGVAAVIAIIVAGIFLANDPGIYRRGIILMVPKTQHRRTHDTLDACGGALKLWLLGTLFNMILVGTLTGIGTWAIGLPAPVALGLFAGLTEFIPFVGPVLGAIPGVVLAFEISTQMVLWTIVLYLIIQQIESNIISPNVMRHAVTVPPAVLMIGFFLFSLLFGIGGVILGAPMTVLAFIAIKKLWVRDALGEQTSLPGAD